jgi:signal transduction histidine kinase/DNA-binding response OmpR family regulator
MTSAEATKVLAIDDDPDICVYIQEILERHHCVVTLAVSGREALKLLATEPFDLVMTDVRLPDIDGVSILEHMRLSGSEIPFVLITGFSENEPIISSMRLGAVDYLTKPFTPSDLEKSLQRALDRKKRLDWSRDLYQISENTDLTLHEKIQKVLLLTADMLSMDVGVVVHSSPDRHGLSFTSGKTEVELDTIERLYQELLLPELSRILQKKEPSYYLQGPQPWVAVPLRMKQQVQGAICFFRQGASSYPGQETARSVLQLTELSISRLLEAEENAVIIANQQSLLLAAQNLSSLGAMATSIAHQIENHLTEIAGRTVMVEKMLQSGGPDSSPRIKVALESIGTDVKRLDRIVKSVRTMAQGNGEPQDSQLLELRSVLEEALELFRCKVQDRPLRLTVGRIPAGYYIQGDSTQILQVFLILLNNSFDSIEGLAEEWIQVDASAVEHTLVIAVTDSSRTMPAHLQEKIFLPFLSRSDTSKDLGLGLSLARKYMEAHQGKLWIDPESPNTRFVLQFMQLQDAQGHPR